MRRQLSQISNGDFTPSTEIEWNNELGDIGRGINFLAENIEHLIDTRIADAKEKKDLEYKVLQNQINPHFLYNTLNSIKWMTTIQGATGICEMTTSLSRLLRSISKGTKLLIPLSEEIALVKDYFNIQNYRYGGTIIFEVCCEDDTFLDTPIIKFTLQPIVENAIFHGLEPKGGSSTIRMTDVVKTLDERSSSTDTKSTDLSLKELQSLKDKFFIRLLHNLYDSECQFETLRHDLNIPFNFPFCQCCYFEMNNADGDSMNIEQQVALYTASYQLMQEIISKYIPAYYVNLDRRHGVTIFLLDNEPSSSLDLIQILKQTGNSLYNYYKTRLKCGIGTKVNTALSLSDSYQAARISFSNIIDNCDPVLICDGF